MERTKLQPRVNHRSSKRLHEASLSLSHSPGSKRLRFHEPKALSPARSPASLGPESPESPPKVKMLLPGCRHGGSDALRWEVRAPHKLNT